MSAGPGRTVTVVIPVKDAGAYLREALDSVVTQEDVDPECVVVDDGSSDRPDLVVEEVAARSGRSIHLVRNSVNRGRSYSRNLGASLATGEVIAFLDADDRYRARHLAAILELLRRRPGCVYTVPSFIDQAGVSLPAEVLPADVPEVLVLAGRASYTSGIAVTRDRWASFGGFDPTLEEREDWELMLRGLRAEVPLSFSTHGGVEIRRHPQNSSRNSDRFLRDTLRVASRARAVAAAFPRELRSRALNDLHARIAETAGSRTCATRYKLAGFVSGCRSAALLRDPRFRRSWLLSMMKLVLPSDALRRVWHRRTKA
jgi:glycosyltransferase involved in cell wall biosynthesis